MLTVTMIAVVVMVIVTLVVMVVAFVIDFVLLGGVVVSTMHRVDFLQFFPTHLPLLYHGTCKPLTAMI